MSMEIYGLDGLSRSAEQTLDILDEMEYDHRRIEEAERYLEQATDAEELDKAYDRVEHAYDTLRRHEDVLEGVRIDPPGDILLLRNAVTRLDNDL